MNPESLKQALVAALTGVRNPRTGTDVLAGGQVKDLEVSEEGEARFSFALGPSDAGTLVRDARAAAEGVTGIKAVKVNVELPRAGGDRPPRQPGLQPGSVPAPTPKPGILPDVRHVVAVSSGKGGVGKSMVAANLAAALAAGGARVGLLDADVYGPNIPIMFGETRRPAVTGGKGQERIEPLEAHGVRLMSLGFLLETDQPAIMRGPLIAGVLRQFIEQVAWGALDVLVVDMPPGTGDAQLSLAQIVPLSGAVLVTTPQAVSTFDVGKAIGMFRQVNVDILGIVENMAGYAVEGRVEGAPAGAKLQLEVGTRTQEVELGEGGAFRTVVNVFGQGGAESLAAKHGFPVLGRLPLNPAVRVGGDGGDPVVVSAPDSPLARHFTEVAGKLAQRLAVKEHQELPILQ
ncbi:MAG: Mrp/NBP35 family ATP-binding protein [Gemmatimonadetes bacterium]|nr:Mrp/NBP35 family ATP-binding protein [Gemmatimonadota bacterium]